MQTDSQHCHVDGKNKLMCLLTLKLCVCYNAPEHERMPVEITFLQAKQPFVKTERHPRKLSVSYGKKSSQIVLSKKQRNIDISENIYICFKKL